MRNGIRGMGFATRGLGTEVNVLFANSFIAYLCCKTAGKMQNWSPYAEVRAVTLPYDDPEEPCESVRAYVLGFFWVCVCTAVNTCEFLAILSASLARDECDR
jgi:hypothetical protein